MSECKFIDTPFGELKVDNEILNELKKKTGYKKLRNSEDENEHSLEMQYPFLKFCAQENVRIIPIMIGNLRNGYDKKYADILQEYFDNDENLFIFSTDFCHWGERFGFTPMKKENEIYKYIEELDHKGIDFILNKDADGFKEYIQKSKNTICGRHPLMIMNQLVKNSTYKIKKLNYAQSEKIKSKYDSSVSYLSGIIYKD